MRHVRRGGSVFEGLFTAQSLVALATLTILEIVLGIDNVIFIAITSGGLPEEQRPRAQRIGLTLALLGRIVLVLAISWLLQFNEPLFTIRGNEFSINDLIFIAGGLFLLYKATVEIFRHTELQEAHEASELKSSFASVVAQIVVIDMVFAFDSVLTAIGLTEQIVLIIIAMTIAILVMMFYATPLSAFIHKHPSVTMLALSFLVLIGVMLFVEGFGGEIERGYVYFAILFSMGVEALNFRRRANLRRRLGVPEDDAVETA